MGGRFGGAEHWRVPFGYFGEVGFNGCLLTRQFTASQNSIQRKVLFFAPQTNYCREGEPPRPPRIQKNKNDKSPTRFLKTHRGAKIFTQLVSFWDSWGARGSALRMIILGKTGGAKISSLISMLILLSKKHQNSVEKNELLFWTKIYTFLLIFLNKKPRKRLKKISFFFE